jgi:hypothetical protein
MVIFTSQLRRDAELGAQSQGAKKDGSGSISILGTFDNQGARSFPFKATRKKSLDPSQGRVKMMKKMEIARSAAGLDCRACIRRVKFWRSM